MADMEPIAARSVIAREKSSDTRIEVTIEVFLPRIEADGRNVRCLARFHGIPGEEYDVGGIDTLQALTLAVQHLKNRFRALRDERYNFFWPVDGSPMESFDYAIGEDGRVIP